MRCGLKTGEEALSSTNKTDVEASTSVSCSDGDSVVEKAESEASSTSEELQVFNDNSSFIQKETTSSRRGPLPPRAPVSSSDPRVLPSQPSIVRRMMDANKPYVDPKDARTLLPGVLLRSGSLDLEGAIEDGATKQTEDVNFNEKLQEEALLRILQAQELERINENLMYNHQQQHQQDPLLAAANLELLANALNESCRVSPGGNLLQTTPLQTNSNALLQQMMPRSRHMRSLSEPTFAFPETPQAFSPFNQSFNGAPVLDPNAETLALLGLTGSTGGSFQQSNWPTQQQQQQPTQNLIPNDQASAMMADLLNQQQDLKNRRKTVGSRSVDFTALKQPKRNGVSPKDKSPAINPVLNAGGPAPKNPTKAEVKKLVEKQTSMGRPTYAPWFRDRSGQPMKTNAKDDLQIGQNSPSPRHRAQGPTPGHNRSVSTPGIAFNIDENEVCLPPPGFRPPPSQGTKPKGAGTGVFLPRLPT